MIVFGESSGRQCVRSIRPSLPLKQCWFLGKGHAVLENVFVYNNAKCLRNRPTLFQGGGGCVQSIMVELLRRL